MTLDCRIYSNSYINVASTLKQCKPKLIEKDKTNLKLYLFNDSGQINGNKLRTYRLYKTEIQTETYVKFPITRDHHRIVAMFRCGNLPLPKLGVLLDQKFLLITEHVFIAMTLLKMSSISLLTVPFMTILEENCSKKLI